MVSERKHASRKGDSVQNETEDSSEYVVCQKCKKNGMPKSQIEGDVWTCPECDERGIVWPFINWIQDKIRRLTTEGEYRGRMSVREVVQNADDAEADTIVFRFDDDALYVANDGRAFRTGKDGDFDRLRRILGEHKKKEENVTGYYGSGFWTVYTITNTPEVHSNGYSRWIDPVKQEWNNFALGSPQSRGSPYATQSKKGVLFRFPWRTEEEARRLFGKERPFVGRQWPTWKEKDRSDMYKDLKEYLPSLILCARNLKEIGIVWAGSGEKKPKGVLVSREFLPTQVKTPMVGSLVVKDCYVDKSFNESFDTSKWESHQERKIDYFVNSGQVRNLNMLSIRSIASGQSKASGVPTVRFVRKKNDDAAPMVIKEYDNGVPDTHYQPKKPEMQVCMPLASSIAQGVPIACVYSYMPLPIDSPNRFAVNADVFVDESRKGIIIQGKEGEWYYLAIFSAALLYLETFLHLLTYIKRLSLPDDLKQKIILDNLPGGSVRHWMRPRTTDDKVSHNYDILDSYIRDSICSQEILLVNGRWTKPQDCCWLDYEDQHDEEYMLLSGILRALEVPVPSGAITKHPNFKSWLDEGLERSGFGPERFAQIWNGYAKGCGPKDGSITVGKRCGGGTLTKAVVAKLLRYCFEFYGSDSRVRSLRIVPARNGKLYSVNDLKAIPKQFKALEKILPKSKIIDFSIAQESFFGKNEQYSILEILKLISDTYLKSPKLFEDNEGDHFQTAATVLTEACRNWDTLNLESAREYHFITCVKHGKGLLCKPNAYAMEDRTIWEYGPDRRNLPLYYEQNHILVASADVAQLPGITPEALDGMTFLHLPTQAQQEIVAKRLPFITLEKDSLRAWVGIFLAGSRSLFDKKNIERFFGRVVSQKELFDQREQFQESLRVYFHDGPKSERIVAPMQWRDVECLYDSNKHWHAAKEFAYEIDEATGFFGYIPLHRKFKGETWTREALKAISVAEHPEPDKIRRKVKEFLGDKEKNRDELAEIAVYLLLSSSELGELEEELSRSEWVAVSDKKRGFVNPKKVLLPSESNVKTLGESFPWFLDVSESQRRRIEKYVESLSPKVIKETKPKLGFKLYPTISDLLTAVVISKGSPPAALFDELEKAVRLDQWDYSYDASTLRYYYGNRWLTAREMVLKKDADTPDEFASIVEVGDSPHKKYLERMGAKRTLDPGTALGWIANHRKSATPEVWKWVARKHRQSESPIQSDVAAALSDSRIVPLGGKIVAPKSLVIADADEDVKEPIIAAGLTLVGIDSLPVEKPMDARIFSDIGAKTLDDCGLDDLNVLLKQVGRLVSSNSANSDVRLFYSLLARLAALDKDAKVPSGKVPAKVKGQWVMIPTAKAMYPDSYVAIRFVDDLPILPIGLVRSSEPLRNLLRNKMNGTTDFTTYLETGCDSPPEQSPEQTKRLREALMAVALYLGSKESAKPLEWWLRVEVCYADTTTVRHRVTVPNEEPIEKDAVDEPHLDPKNKGWVLLVPRMGPEGIYENIAESLLVSRDNEGEVPRYSELKLLVPQLLRLPLADWRRFVPAYNYAGTAISPMVRYLSGSLLEEHWSFHKTLGELLAYYQGCQICGARTPNEWESSTTEETLKQVFSPVRGIPLQTLIEGYKVGNSILLCPRHHYLFERKCVRPQLLWGFIDCLPEEGGSRNKMENVASQLRRRLSEVESERTKEYSIDCEEWDNGLIDGIHSGNPRSRTIPMVFKRQHYLELLKWMATYLEKRIEEEQH